jgi:predicted esterase
MRKNTKRCGLGFAVLAAGLGLLPCGMEAAQEFETGKIIENVVSLADPGQNYALYLPPAFDPAKKWPVLFLFDPSARGALAVGRFREAADAFGWILVGSNNSRNGPGQLNVQAAQALWADSLKRLPLDERRIYAAGFSGGSRVASIFGRVINRPLAGIIGCGAGLNSTITPAGANSAAYVGLAGLADFNCREMKSLAAAFQAAGLAHRFIFFDGRHDWPNPALCWRAAGWLEVMAMKDGRRPKDAKLAEDVVAREIEEAGIFEAAGRWYWAADRLEEAERLAEGLVDVPGLRGRVEVLKAKKEYGQFLSDEERRDKAEGDFLASCGRTFGAVEEEEAGMTARDVLRELRIWKLLEDVKRQKTVEDRSFASRLLFNFSYAAQSRAGELYEKDRMILAALYLDLAIAACEEGLPREPFLYFNRACVAVRNGEKKRALEFLAAAVDKGFSDMEALETSKDLEKIRDTARFKEILDKARKKTGAALPNSNLPP